MIRPPQTEGACSNAVRSRSLPSPHLPAVGSGDGRSLAAKLALVPGAGARVLVVSDIGELGLALKDVLCCSIRLSLAGSPYPVTAPPPSPPAPLRARPTCEAERQGPWPGGGRPGAAPGPYMCRYEHQRHERRQRNRTRYLMLNPKRSSVRCTVEGRSTWAVQYMPH